MAGGITNSKKKTKWDYSRKQALTIVNDVCTVPADGFVYSLLVIRSVTVRDVARTASLFVNDVLIQNSYMYVMSASSAGVLSPDIRNVAAYFPVNKGDVLKLTKNWSDASAVLEPSVFLIPMA